MISIFDLFSIGVGPSSSHTVGPMRAGQRFSQRCSSQLNNIETLRIEIFGSLAHTGVGHGTDKAILLGLENHLPEHIDPDHIEPRLAEIKQQKQLKFAGEKTIQFDFQRDFIFNYKDLLPRHTNGMHFQALNKDNEVLFEQDYYSIGGGFIITNNDDINTAHTGANQVPYPFNTTADLIKHCEEQNKTIAEIMFANECAERQANEVKQGVLNIANVMFNSIERGCKVEGTLPGGLDVKRRAPELARKLGEKPSPCTHEHVDSIDWLNVYAIAVNEENAAGSRVVTAPTNGAAGIIPAVLKYYQQFYPDVTDDKLIEFMLTAAAIAVLYKKGASISAAEVGCQGEVGVASSMAAGALTAVLGGNLPQITSAAEIAMEHNLGLTCDPINGLVQIPCIERNAIGAVKAVNCARLALIESPEHKKVSLDKVIDTMRRTGEEMTEMYKETSKGGLAKIRVNVIEC